jgi:beta-glucanase (GH16 family)
MLRQITFIAIVTVLSALSCKKGGNNSNADVVPTNLTVNAVVSNDNSGNVEFTAVATNATTYEFGYGNGVFALVPTGKVTYKYPATGTYTVKVIAKSASGKTISTSIQVVVSVGLSLIFSDEFNTPGAPDPSKWGYDVGTGSNGWGNQELQYYTSRTDNAVVQNGVLRITLQKENYLGSAYTSARLLTANKFSFKYGIVEARLKLPAGGGTWPAAWMLGANITTVGWPACGEIDFMEHKGNDLNRIFGTLHYPGRSGGSANGSSRIISNATTEFHIYKVEWTALAIKIFVDDVMYHSVPNSTAIPFNHNFFIILNVAMGGTFGGAVDPNFQRASMEVDYVRVYQ